MLNNPQLQNNYVKKIESDVDNVPGFSEKRYYMICQIQKFLKEGCSYREIAKRMGIGRNTIAKYREGDPKELSMYGIRQSKLDPFYDFIVQCLNSGWSKSKTVSVGKDKDYITREGVFRHMWMNTELADAHKKYIYEKYPNIRELHCCIKEFRNIFKKRNVPLLYLFVEKYSKSKIKALKSFSEGLKRDMDAVESAVAYDYSNGFVEGTNSRLKMIKRTMYGRCGKQLLLSLIHI